MLGFIDDLFDIRWRHKLPIPLIAAIPTLLVYYSESGLTSVVLPGIVGRWLAPTGLGWEGSKVVDLGKLICRCHLSHPDDVFRTTVLPVLAHAPYLHH
jgi:UDP-N-acetylglucosamine--dolichyl-phosphate N-acetylglucosaminephosphotransferase